MAKSPTVVEVVQSGKNARGFSSDTGRLGPGPDPNVDPSGKPDPSDATVNFDYHNHIDLYGHYMLFWG